MLFGDKLNGRRMPRQSNLDLAITEMDQTELKIERKTTGEKHQFQKPKKLQGAKFGEEVRSGDEDITPLSEDVKRGPGSSTCPGPPMEFALRFLFSVQSWAKTWIRQVDPLRGTFRNEPDDNYDEVDTAIVSYQVSCSFA